MKKKKKKGIITINLEYFAVLFTIRFIQALPLKAAFAFSRVVMKILYRFDTLHSVRTVQHLMHAGIVKNVEEAKELAMRNYYHFGKVLVEIFKMHQFINRENFREHIKLNCSPETYDYLVGHPKQVILVTAHCGNWEVAGMCYTLLSHIPLLSVKRPFYNPKIGDLVFHERESYLHSGCEKKGAIKAMLGALKRGESIAIVADQHASTSEGVESVFFGHPARTHASPARLHLKTGVPIVVSITRRVDDNFHFEYVIKDPIVFTPTGDRDEDTKKITQIYTSQLQELISEYPEQWLWAHRRWLDINRTRNKR